MKKLTTAIVTTATLLVLIGCGDESSLKDKNLTDTPLIDDGVKIPDELSKKADLNETIAGGYLKDILMSRLGMVSTIQSAKPSRDGAPNMSGGGTCLNGGTYHYDQNATRVVTADSSLDKVVVECSANNCEADPASVGINNFMDICVRDLPRFSGFNLSSNPTVRTTLTKYKLNGSYKRIVTFNIHMDGGSVSAQRYDFQTKIDNFSSETLYDNNTSELLSVDGNKTAYVNLVDDGNKHKHTEKIGIDEKLIVKYYYIDNNITNGFITDINNKERIVRDTNTTNGDYNSMQTDDGYIINYTVSGSEDNKTVVSVSGLTRDKSVAYDALVISSIKRGDVTTSKVEGGYSVYPNGMVDITTAPLVKHNITFHVSAGNSVLPYSGKFKLVANNVAEFMFEKDDQNKTSATLRIDGAVVERYNTTTDLPNLIQLR